MNVQPNSRCACGRKKWFKSVTCGKCRGSMQPIKHEPTPAEIEQAAAAIREQWSDEEHRKRAGKTVEAVEVALTEFVPQHRGGVHGSE